MDIAIFGCGYVGTAIAREASRRGLQVWALTRNPDYVAELNNLQGVVAVRGQIEDSEWEGSFPAKVGTVINSVSASSHAPEGYSQAYVGSNWRLVDFLKGKDVRQYLYTGSTGIYPQSNGEVVTEADGEAPASPNGKILKEAEEIILKAEHIPTRIILRLCGIYGPGRHYILDKLRRGDLDFPDSGEHFMNLVYLKDIISAVFTAVDANLQGAQVYNVSDGHPELKKTAVEWLCKELGLEAPRFSVDDAPGGRAAGRRLEGGNLPSRQISNEKIRQELGWTPVYNSYQAGFREILQA